LNQALDHAAGGKVERRGRKARKFFSGQFSPKERKKFQENGKKEKFWSTSSTPARQNRVAGNWRGESKMSPNLGSCLEKGDKKENDDGNA